MPYYLRTEVVQDVLRKKHCPHQVMARLLGLSPSYWSRLVNGRVPASRAIRWDIKNNPIFESVPEDSLWTER